MNNRKFILISAGLFLAYAIGVHCYQLIQYYQSIEFFMENMDQFDLSATIIDSPIDRIYIIWIIFYSILTVIWVFSLLKKSIYLQNILYGIMLISAILMHFTAQIETSFYVDDVIVGGEIIDQ
jgi:hypothetical protein